mmetsp:Transcript_60879/g.173035  ORF Transcript_60879/g.173035 Transcript_60879/m.173035 type:complete len:296 (+) Transcript_60879:1794-2681(+)
MVKVQLLHDLQGFASRRRRHHVLIKAPSHRANHGNLHMVPNKGTIPQGRDCVAASQRMAQQLGHLLGVHNRAVRLALRVAGVELDLRPECALLDADDAVKVHSLLRDCAGLVEDHRGNLPGDGDATGLQAVDLVRRGQAPRRHGLPHDHADGQHRAQAHCHGVDNHQVRGDPVAKVRNEDVDDGHGDQPEEHDEVHRRQLVIVLEPHACGEEDHANQLAARGECAHCAGDHDRLAAGPRGLQAVGAGVGCVFLRDTGTAGILHRHLVHWHGLSCQHRLVHDEAPFDHDSIAGKLG